jgi:hypothetical protein
MDTFKIKKGDKNPALSVTLEYSNGSAIDLSNGSVWFNMGNITTYAPYTSGQCVITGSTSGQCEYHWSGTIDTGSVGRYWGEFEFKCAGSILTLPTDHSLKIEIYEDYN